MPLFSVNWKPNLEVSSDLGLAFKVERLCIGPVFFLLHNVRPPSFSDTVYSGHSVGFSNYKVPIYILPNRFSIH